MSFGLVTAKLIVIIGKKSPWALERFGPGLDQAFGLCSAGPEMS